MPERRRLRLTAYTDAVERGGAETSLAILVGALGPHIDVTVVGVTQAVVEWIAAARPGSRTVVLPPIRDKRDVRQILAHLRSIRRLRPDIFHANLRHPWSCQYGIAAALVTRGTCAVAVEHALIPSGDRLQRALKRVTSSRLAAHVAVGEKAAREIEEITGVRRGSMRVIYTGVPLPDSPVPARGGDGFVVGSLGRFSQEKGLDVLLRALAMLDGVSAVLVGDGAERPALERLARELGVADRIEMTGWEDDISARLRSIDVLVSPSRGEAFGLALLEAMAAGLAVIATDVGSVSEAVADEQTGLLVAPDDPAALAGAIRELRDDPERRRRLGRRGRALAAERFAPAAMARAFEALYDEIRKPS